MALKIDENNFEQEVLKSSEPVLVDFWASWCGPCKMMAPVVDELSDEIKNVKICKVNVDENPSLAQEYGILSIPCFILFKNGNIFAQKVGAMPKDELESFAKS